MPTFLVDECVSLQTARLLEALGFSIENVHDLGRSGVPDTDVFKIAQDKKSVLVTYDRGFGDLRKYPPYSQGESIEETMENVREAIEAHLEALKEDQQEIPSEGKLLIGKVEVAFGR